MAVTSSWPNSVHCKVITPPLHQVTEQLGTETSVATKREMIVAEIKTSVIANLYARRSIIFGYAICHVYSVPLTGAGKGLKKSRIIRSTYLSREKVYLPNFINRYIVKSSNRYPENNAMDLFLHNATYKSKSHQSKQTTTLGNFFVTTYLLE